MFQYSFGVFFFSFFFFLRQFVWCVWLMCLILTLGNVCFYCIVHTHHNIIRQHLRCCFSLALSIVLYSSMKWRALICVYSYFAFYFSSVCVCVYFVSVLLSEMQMFVLKRLRSVKCHSVFFCPCLLCSHGEKRNTNQCMRESER